MEQGNYSMAEVLVYNSTILHGRFDNTSEYIYTTVKDNVTNDGFQEANWDNVLYITQTGASVTYSYFAICMITILLAGWIISLNGLVIHTLLYHKPHSDVTDYFVSSLSIADFTTGCLLIYMTSYSLAQFQNCWECLFRFGLTYAISQSSFLHILAITFDRYVKVIYPLRYFSMFTKRTVIVTSVAIWSVSIIIGLLPLLGWHKELKLNDSGTVCRFFGILPDGYFIFNFLTSLITSLGMLILYMRIIHVAIRQRKQMKVLMAGTQVAQAHLDDQTWRLVKTVAIIVLVSNLCWLPGVVLIALHISGDLDHMTLETKGDLITYCGFIAFLNSLINPLIYAVKIDEVKKRFASILCCRRSHQQWVPSQSKLMKSSNV